MLEEIEHIYVLDTETTGVSNHPVHGHPQVIELAYIPIGNDISRLVKAIVSSLADSSLEDIVSSVTQEGYVSRFKPSMDIHPRAREVHGIWMKDLLSKPKSESLELPKMRYMVGHNIQYDYRCLGKPEGISLICTLKLARVLDKKLGIGFKNHKQDELLLHFYGEDIRPLITGHHAALTDCVKCILLLVKLLGYIPAITTFADLFLFQENIKKAK